MNGKYHFLIPLPDGWRDKNPCALVDNAGFYFDEYAAQHMDENNFSTVMHLVLPDGRIVPMVQNMDYRGRDERTVYDTVATTQGDRWNYTRQVALVCVLADMEEVWEGWKRGLPECSNISESEKLTLEGSAHEFVEAVKNSLQHMLEVLKKKEVGSRDKILMWAISSLRQQLRLFQSANYRPFATIFKAPYEYRAYDLRACDIREKIPPEECAILVVDIHT